MTNNQTSIILVATDNGKKNVVFVDNALQTYPLDQAVGLAGKGLFEDICIANRSGHQYLRTKPNALKGSGLDCISVSPNQLFSAIDDIERALSIPVFRVYWEAYQRSLSEKEEEDYITIDGHRRISQRVAKSKLLAHKDIIFAAAKEFDIDTRLLSAIVIDEIARVNPVEAITDFLSGYFVGRNTSAGIAQVKTDTAYGLIKTGYYNPDPNKFSSSNIGTVSRRVLYEYVKQPKHSIFFAAARIRSLADEWKRFVDLIKRPDILATLYSLPYRKPHGNPEANERGRQVAGEFYELARTWLG